MDYLKYDWCSRAARMTKDDDAAVYTKMGDALQKTGRPIVYSLCQYGRDDVWEWGPQVGGNLWRTTGDISDNWESMAEIGFNSESDCEKFAGPGHWNDPDMLEVGNGGMNDDEYRTHMSLWAILAAPLLAGNDLSRMTPDDARNSYQPRSDRHGSGPARQTGVSRVSGRTIRSLDEAHGGWEQSCRFIQPPAHDRADDSQLLANRSAKRSQHSRLVATQGSRHV